MHLSIIDKKDEFHIELVEDLLKDFSCKDHWISLFEVSDAEFAYIQNELEPSFTNGFTYTKEPLTEGYTGVLKRFYSYAFDTGAEYKLPPSFKTKCEHRVDDLRRDIYYKDIDVGGIDEEELRRLLHLFDKQLSDEIRSGQFNPTVVGLRYLQEQYIDKKSHSPSLFLLLKEELFTEGSRIHEMIIRQGYKIDDEGDGSSYIKRL